MLIRTHSASVRLGPRLAGLVLAAFGLLGFPLQGEELGATMPAGDPVEANSAPVSLVVQWWQKSDIVEATGLRPDQIESLDGLWREAFEAREAGRAEQARLFLEFTEALRSNAPGGRAELVDRLAESAAAQARLPAELMDRGIQVLDSEQHRRIQEDFPWIFRRSWMGRLTTREQRLKTSGKAFRIEPSRIHTRGEEHE